MQFTDKTVVRHRGPARNDLLLVDEYVRPLDATGAQPPEATVPVHISSLTNAALSAWPLGVEALGLCAPSCPDILAEQPGQRPNRACSVANTAWCPA